MDTFLFGLVAGANLAWVFTSLCHEESMTQLFERLKAQRKIAQSGQANQPTEEQP